MFRSHFSSFFTIIYTLALPSWCAAVPASKLDCSSSSIAIPDLAGARIATLTAAPVQNFTINVPQNGAGPYFNTNYTGLDFCNVTITYSYLDSGSDFSIRTTVWLPTRNWNGRFQGTGGSGFLSGLGVLGLAPAVASGYAAAETDGGHSEIDSDPTSWALNRQGRVDLRRLVAFASTSLHDLAVLGKAVTTSFYGIAPKYSYWNGCSTGGRQGLMLAQRYPSAFDGIAAISPAINWPSLTVATYWPQQVMNQINHYPHECELAYITKQAVSACDAEDGVRDGILSLPGLCKFDASETIGEVVKCDGISRSISATTAAVANAAWSGSGIWYGLNHDALLEGMANTTCSGPSDGSCVGNPFDIAPWIPLFVEQNPNFPITNMTNGEYLAVFQKSVLQYQSIIGTADPDLSPFHAAGGKMITTHGLADPAIFPNGTLQYYQSVLFFDENAKDYYRVFEAPGIGHCASLGTQSFYPSDTFEALVKWVEHGQAPDVLTGLSERGNDLVRPLCPYPKEQHYMGGDPNDAGSFQCR
jgi:hypothetical protein